MERSLGEDLGEEGVEFGLPGRVLARRAQGGAGHADGQDREAHQGDQRADDRDSRQDAEHSHDPMVRDARVSGKPGFHGSAELNSTGRPVESPGTLAS